MVSIIDIVVPPTGEVIDSARIVNWIVSPGKEFKVGDILLEIETDKSIIEIPSREAGVMVEHLVSVDGLLNSDTPIARIQIESISDSVDQALHFVETDETQEKSTSSVLFSSESSLPIEEKITNKNKSLGRKFVTPFAYKLAKKNSISINAINGTGPHGRITQSDLMRSMAQQRLPDALKMGISDSDRIGMREAVVSTSYGEISINLWESSSNKNGKTLVLIHGIFGDSSTWASMAHAAHRAGLRVLAIDLPCHGKTKSDVNEFTKIVETISEVILNQCESAVVLVGHSFGGAVAARVAHMLKQRIDSLVLIAPVGIGTEIEQGFLNGMTHADSNEAIQRELSKLTVAGIIPSSTYVSELRARIHVRRDPLIELCRRFSWNGVQQIDVIPDLLSFNSQCIVIQGRRDDIVHWKQVLNLPPRVALHLLSDAGHMPHWESTTLVTDIVLRAIVEK